MTHRSTRSPRLLALIALACIAMAGPSRAQSTVTAAAKPMAAAASAAAVVTASGLSIATLREGSGASPQASDRVKVHYRGSLPDGTEFDSSYSRGEPASFALARVIPCWTEGVQRMKVGGKARLICPSKIAYGERGAGGVIPPNATLVFEVELLEILGR